MLINFEFVQGNCLELGKSGVDKPLRRGWQHFFQTPNRNSLHKSLQNSAMIHMFLTPPIFNNDEEAGTILEPFFLTCEPRDNGVGAQELRIFMYPRRKITPVNLGQVYLYSSTVPVDGRPLLGGSTWFCYGSGKETERIRENFQQ